MLHTFKVINSTLASSVRGWRGTSSSRSVVQPSKDLILFDREGDPECRLVREAITALNLDVTVMPCPIGGKNLKSLEAQVGSTTIPMLYDANVEESRTGAAEIIAYLYLEYKGSAPKERDLPSKKVLRSSLLSSLIRLNSGCKARKAKSAELPLTLYSFESSPFSRLVRERLCELELPYKLITLGKQQKQDMGPAKLRMTLKPYKPLPNTKRDEFFKQHGNVQVPFLVDPNTQTELFESHLILKYLEEAYAR